MIKNICSLINRDLFSHGSHLVNIRLDASVEIDLLIIEEEGILSLVPPVGLLLVPSSFQVVITVVEICWFKVLSCFLVPHWVRESSLCCLQKRPHFII